MADYGSVHNRFMGIVINEDYSNADFSQAQKKVAKSEGGYQNLYNDSGNWTSGKVGIGSQIGTNWGISAPVLSQYLGRTATVSDMKNLSYETALKIYKKNYWTPIGGDNIRDDSVALIIYDGAVNNGVAGIKNIVKDSLGIASYDVNAINKIDGKKAFELIKSGREKAYKRIGGQFVNSWLNRLNSYAYSGLQTIKAHPIITVLVTATILFSAYFLIFGKTKKA
jgi:lysozyme family protein